MSKKTYNTNIILMLFLCLFISFPPVFAGEPKYGGTLRIGVRIPQYNRLDGRDLSPPGLAPSASMIYDGLTNDGPKGAADPVPGLATSWETKDNKIWIFHIRKGVKFHNGREMTAQDIKQNFDWRIETPKGWKPIRWREQIRGLKKTEVIDKYTVKITLENPFSDLIGVLSWAMRAIVPPEEAHKWGDQFYSHAVGTGPYKLVEVKPKEKVVFERFDDYWGPKPYIDRLEYIFIRSPDARLIALQKGELDFAMLQFEAKPVLDKDPNLTWEENCNHDIMAKYYFNMRRWPMNDVRFRRAVWMSADWKNIVTNALPFKSGRYPRTLLDNTPYFNPEAMKLIPQYNLEEAKKLIKAVQKDAGKKIQPIYFLDTTHSPEKDVAELAKISMEQIGVPVDLHLMSFAAWGQKLLRDPKLEWDIGQIGEAFQRSPSRGFRYFVTNSGVVPDGKSLGAYSNPEFDKWVNISETSMDEKERIKAVQEAEKILIKDCAVIPLFYINGIYAWNKKVKGIILTDSVIINVTTSWGANMWIDN